MCNACRNARGPRVRHHEAIDVHAIEMVVLNAKALQRLFAEFHVPGTVHHLALSNYSGIATYGSATAVGLEHFELDKWARVVFQQLSSSAGSVSRGIIRGMHSVVISSLF